MRSPEQQDQPRMPESFITFRDRLSGAGWTVRRQLNARRVRKDIESRDPLERLFDSHFELLNTHNEEKLKTALYTTAIASGVIERTAHRKIRRALKIAEHAHEEQTRKFSDDSFKVHPIRTAILAIELAREMKVTVTTELIVGAILHDTIEDNPKAIYPGFLREIYDDMGARYAWKIEADAEALSRFVTMPNSNERKKLVGQAYVRKLSQDPLTGDPVDRETHLRRIIIKTADRLDNLLDPPIHTENYTGKDSLTSSRRKIITKTKGNAKEEGDVKPLLEANLPDTKYLLDILNIALVLSQRSIDDSDFDPARWKEYTLAA